MQRFLDPNHVAFWAVLASIATVIATVLTLANWNSSVQLRTNAGPSQIQILLHGRSPQPAPGPTSAPDQSPATNVPGTSSPATSPTTSHSPSPSPCRVDGRITYPANNDRVTPLVDDVTGTVSCVPTGYSVWLVTEIVGPDGNPYYDAFKEQPQTLWPAPNRVTMLTGTTWQSKVPFGDETTVASGLRFQLTLIVADATVDNQFEGYNHSPHPSGYTGIELKSITGLYQRLNHVDVVRV